MRISGLPCRVRLRVKGWAVLFLLAGRNSSASESIAINYEGTGCFHQEQATYRYRADGVDLIESGGIRLPKGILDDLLKAAANSSRVRTFAPELIGVDEHEFLRRRPSILRVALNGLPASEVDRPAAENALVYGLTLRLAEDYFTMMDSSTEHADFNFDYRGAVTLNVHSKHMGPGMLPMSVTWNGRTWETYDPELPRRFLKLVGLGSLRNHLDVDAGMERFWVDGFVWGRAIGDASSGSAARKMASNLDGFEQTRQVVSVEKYEIGDFNSEPRSLLLNLAIREDALIDSVLWFNHLNNGRPQSDWYQLIKTLKRGERAVENVEWLKTWKTSGQDNHIELTVSGKKMHESNRGDDELAWKDAGLTGRPEIEIILRRKDVWVGTVVISDGESRSIIVDANPDRRSAAGIPDAAALSGNHWFDRLSDPQYPNYILVSVTGIPTPRKVGRKSSQ